MPLQLSMALGAGETTLLRLTTAYAMLVNGGQADHADPDRPGPGPQRPHHLPARPARPVPAARPMSLAAAAAGPAGSARAGRRPGQRLSGGLHAAGRGGARHRPADRARSASRWPARPAPPTTAFDTWFVGFSPDLAVGVFVGFDEPPDARPTEGDRLQRGGADVPRLHGRRRWRTSRPSRSASLRHPAGAGQPDTGRLAARRRQAASIWEAFKPGTVPTGEAVVIDGGYNPGRPGGVAPAGDPGRLAGLY